MDTRWVVVANNIGAKIYSTKPSVNGRLTLVTELTHPEGLLHGKDFATDRPGHTQMSGSLRSSVEQHNSKDLENDNFTRHLAEFLDAERNKNHYHFLTLVMLPHFHGQIEHHLNKHVKAMVDKVIQKNYFDKTAHELEEIIREG